MTALALTRDINGYVTYGLPFSGDNVNFTLEADTEVTITVPTVSSRYAAVFCFEPGASVWVASGSAPIVLPTGTPAATSAQLNPAVREVAPGSTLRFKTGDTSADVGVSFYELT